MIIALYKMKVRRGKTEAFEKAWAEVTEAIAARQASLGSRLHSTADDHVYVAYAQWPDMETFESADPSRYDASQNLSRHRLKETLASVEIMELMEVCRDHLRSPVPDQDPLDRG